MRAICLFLLILGVLMHGCPAGAEGTFPGKGSKQDWLKGNGFFAEGNMLSESHKYAEAITKYKQAVAVYGFSPQYYYDLGLAYKHTGDLSAACDAFNKALALNSHDWRTWKVLGNCRYKMADFPGAKAAYQKALGTGAPATQAAELHSGISACAARMR